MKKFFVLILFFAFFSVSLATAIHFDLDNEDSNEVFIADIGQPAIYNVDITNLGNSGNFSIYNFQGFKITPNQFSLKNLEKESFSFEISQLSEINKNGIYTLNMFVSDGTGSKFKIPVNLEIVELGDSFNLIVDEINPESTSTKIYFINNKDFLFKNINVKFNSDFFTLEKDIQEIKPYEKVEFPVALDKNEFKMLKAGYYSVQADVGVNNKRDFINGKIKFTEQGILSDSESLSGFFITKKIIEKANVGNNAQNFEISVEKNIFSKLFTFFEPLPDRVENIGLNSVYYWTEKLEPGQTIKVVVKTNWIIPIAIFILLCTIFYFTKKHFGDDLKIKKEIKFIKAKGGEFALRVTLILDAKRDIEKIEIVDKLPPLVNLHENFGIDAPNKIDKPNRRLEWNFDKLVAGEKRLLSYVIYSKVGIIGKFALPQTTALYEKAGKIKEVISNKVFFVAEKNL